MIQNLLVLELQSYFSKHQYHEYQRFLKLLHQGQLLNIDHTIDYLQFLLLLFDEMTPQA